MTDAYYTHRVIIGLRCTGCGRSLLDLMRETRWVRGVPTPVCAEAENLRLLAAPPAGDER